MAHLRFEGDADELMEAERMIATATHYAEQYTGRKFSSETVAESYDSFPKGPVELTRAPVTSIDSVTYYDWDLQLQTFDNHRLINRNNKGYIYPALGQSFPTDVVTNEPDVVTITYTAGYSATTTPAPVKSAILLIAASLWENRENEIVGSNIKALKPTIAAKDLLHPFKVR